MAGDVASPSRNYLTPIYASQQIGQIHRSDRYWVGLVGWSNESLLIRSARLNSCNLLDGPIRWCSFKAPSQPCLGPSSVPEPFSVPARVARPFSVWPCGPCGPGPVWPRVSRPCSKLHHSLTPELPVTLACRLSSTSQNFNHGEFSSDRQLLSNSFSKKCVQMSNWDNNYILHILIACILPFGQFEV